MPPRSLRTGASVRSSWLARGASCRALSDAGPECLTRPVAESMTRQVVTCLETDTLDELMALMTARRFRHLPVVTDGDLVGLVSIGDVVKHHVAEIEMEATAMRDYIAHS
jgi:signal-transduction protein with cAMP-binding, CBS, and nucleotidyltransferase domain